MASRNESDLELRSLVWRLEISLTERLWNT